MRFALKINVVDKIRISCPKRYRIILIQKRENEQNIKNFILSNKRGEGGQKMAKEKDGNIELKGGKI